MKAVQMSNDNFTLTSALSTEAGSCSLLQELAGLRSLCQPRCGHVVTCKPRDEVFKNTAVATRGDNVRDTARSGAVLPRCGWQDGESGR